MPRCICSISINSRFNPTPRGILDIPTLYNLSLICDIVSDPGSFRGVFLTIPQNINLLIKWTKILQHHKSHHWVHLPSINNHFLSPIRALQAFLATRSLPPSAPLFDNNFYPYAQVIDTHIRDALKKVLIHRNISAVGHEFHTFRRSRVTHSSF